MIAIEAALSLPLYTPVARISADSIHPVAM
jgi:hypothetical protein